MLNYSSQRQEHNPKVLYVLVGIFSDRGLPLALDALHVVQKFVSLLSDRYEGLKVIFVFSNMGNLERNVLADFI